MASTPLTSAVTDFGQYAELRALARNESPEALRRTAEQFEAVFTQMLLKSMRDASLGEDLLGGSGGEFYRDLFDQQIAVNMSTSGRGLGIAEMLVRQLQMQPGLVDGDPTVARFSRSESRESGQASSPAFPSGKPGYADATQELSRVPSHQSRVPSPGTWEPGGPAEFVTQLLPHAENAARKLGVSPHVLVAQAALETGWGRHLMRHSDGSASFNFFGIKADKRWEGADVRHSTLEFENGQMNRVNASFRSYGSMAEAFDDYADFLLSNPRYAEALQHGGDERHFVTGLQKAGYATDPAYAQKILHIANGETLQVALADSRLLSV